MDKIPTDLVDNLVKITNILVYGMDSWTEEDKEEITRFNIFVDAIKSLHDNQTTKQ